MSEQTSNDGDVFEFPVSATQKTFWYMYQLDPGSTAYSIPFGFQINGKLEPERLQQALTAVVARHEILRTRYHDGKDGSLVQIAGPAELPFRVVDISVSQEERQAELDHHFNAEFHRPILIDREPPLRATVFKLADNEYVLLLVVHHVAIDHEAIGFVLEEMADNYRRLTSGQPVVTDEPDLHYADYVVWRAENKAEQERAQAIETWTKRLEPFSGVLDLPTTHPRPRVQSFEGQDEHFFFSEATSELLRTFSKSRGLSMFTTVLTCLMAVYQRYTRQSDVIVGTPFSDRNHEQLEKVVGCFVNTLPLAAQFDDDINFDQLSSQINEVVLEAYDNQSVSLEDIVHELRLQRDVSRNPLFQVGYVLQDPPKIFELPDASISVLSLENFGAMYDIHMFMWDDGKRVGGMLTYNTSLFDEAWVKRFVATFESAVIGLLNDTTAPVRGIAMLSAVDQELLDGINATDMDVSLEASVMDLFQASVSEHPQKTAVIGADGKLSYAELDAHSSAFAAHLQAQGVGQGDLVGIAVDRDCRMLVALLGIWKAGATYVPLDPEYPNDRLLYMMETAAIRLLVTKDGLTSKLPDYDCPRILLDTQWDEIIATEPAALFTPSSGEDLAYVIFTSGSTGKPKGVQVPHRAVVNFLESMAAEPGIVDTDTLLAVTTLSFDIAVLELYLPICTGATTFIATAEQAGDGKALLNILKSHPITMMQATPSTWRLLIAEGWLEQDDWSAFKVLCGGEAFPVDLARTLTAKVDHVWNMYGPTETTVWSAIKKLSHDEDMRIGKPINNTQLHILNEAGLPVPVGVPGHLHISGAGVTAGYLGRDDLTRASFFPHTQDPNLQIYATGDLVKLHQNGDLEYLQRIDNQVKLRGFRIELGEIETVIAELDDIAGVVASIWSGNGDDKRLVAYVIPKSGKISVIQLRKALRARLPDYMIPQHFVELKEIPKTANGKIDRKALPSPLGLERSPDRKPAVTETEKAVATIWSKALGEPSIARDDYFFDIGGHSILAAEVVFLIEKQFGERLNPRMILMHSLAEISASLDESTAGDRKKA